MKRSVLAAVVALVLGFTPSAHAALVDNGGGLIYDTGLNVTWYDYTYTGLSGTGATWTQAESWAAGLNEGGVTGWTLPTTPGTITGYTDQGEMGQLYYDELGNAEGGPLANTAPFTNLKGGEAYEYWSGTTADASDAWAFYFYNGVQFTLNKDDYLYALAVHSGDVGAPSATPEPTTMMLLGLGLAGVAGARRKFKR